VSLRSDYVPVVDPFGVTRDPAMPFLADALDPLAVEREFAEYTGGMVLRAVRVTRHKPGRRCLIEYQFIDARALHGRDTIILLGKARARSLDQTGYETTQAFWDAGFDSNSPDGIMIPKPVGTVPAFHMWLQRKVPGVLATQLLPTSSGTGLARRVAAAAMKLHQSGVPSDRRHTPADEMRILNERLTTLAAERPELSFRLHWILDACTELAIGLPSDCSHGIHRDFYPDQVLIHGPRLYLLDLDLYTTGDPALDIGNFRGHIIEQSLRSFGRPDALSARELALSEQYSDLAGRDLGPSIDSYTTLTLARHIAISTLFSERRHLTEILMGICEDRLGKRSIVGT
jgi:hypothetical protein